MQFIPPKTPCEQICWHLRKDNENQTQPKSRSLTAAPKTFHSKKIGEFTKSDIEYLLTAVCWSKIHSGNLKKNVSDSIKKLREAVDTEFKKNKAKMTQVCTVSGISRSAFYYNKDNNKKEQRDCEILNLILKPPDSILKRRGSKAKSKEIAYPFGAVNGDT